MKVSPVEVGESRTPEAPSRLFRARFVLLALYLACVAGWYYLCFVDNRLLQMDPIRDWWAGVAMSAVFFGGQALLLSGAPHWRWPRPRRRGAVWVSLLTGSLIAALLSCGVLFAFISFLENHNLVDSSTVQISGPSVLIAIIGMPWLLWTLLFGLMYASEWHTGFGRMYRLLVAGTFLELAITIPIDVQVRKRTNCYCGEGTFFALVIGLTGVFWTFGPGVVLLFLTRRLQRRADAGICIKCGYDLRGLPEPRCPECGTGFVIAPQFISLSPVIRGEGGGEGSISTAATNTESGSVNTAPNVQRRA